MQKSFFLLIPLIGLGACTEIYSPTFMPSGYAYHQEIYKSPPAADPYDIGYDYSPLNNRVVLDEWTLAADDFLRGLEETTDLTPGPVYLDRAYKSSALQQTFDYALRETLREQGYTLVTAGDEQYRTRIVYGVTPISHPYADNYVSATIPSANYLFGADVFTTDPSPRQFSKAYTLPAFDMQSGFQDETDRIQESRTRNQY